MFLFLSFLLSYLMMGQVMLWGVHHFEHREATSAEKADHQHRCHDQENDIEHGGIVPLDALSDRNDIAVLGDKPKHLKQPFDNVSSRCHRDIKGHQNIAHHFPAVVFAINKE